MVSSLRLYPYFRVLKWNRASPSSNLNLERKNLNILWRFCFFHHYPLGCFQVSLIYIRIIYYTTLYKGYILFQLEKDLNKKNHFVFR